MHIIDWIVWVDGKVVCFRSFAHDLRTSQCSVPRDPIIELSSPPSSKSNAHPSIQPSSHQYLRGSGAHEDTSHSEWGVTLVEPLVSFELNGAVAVYVSIIIVISGVRWYIATPSKRVTSISWNIKPTKEEIVDGKVALKQIHPVSKALPASCLG